MRTGLLINTLERTSNSRQALTCSFVLLMLLLPVASADELRSSPSTIVSQPLQQGEQSDLPNGLTVRRMTLEELRTFPDRPMYVPISPERLRELAPQADSNQIPSSVRNPARIRSAFYRARFSGQQLIDGQLELQINREVAEVLSGPLPLGSTNLEGLSILDNGESVPVGATRDRSLFVLKAGGAAELNGIWHAAGAVTGDVVSFRLELPEATSAVMELLTPPSIHVICNNGLALGPEVQGEHMRWLLYPAAANRLSFSCQLRRSAEHGSALALTSVVASHTVGLDSLTSRWTIGLPGNTENRNRLQISLPASVRVTEVLTNDTPTGDWQSSVNGEQQQLNVVLPSSGLASNISISGLSTSPSTGSWPLPLMTPVSWSSDSPQANGPVLMPVSQINVTIPRSIEIDGWTLEGIQERDMVPGADDTRVCQLTRFASNASATLHASGNQPRLGESLVTALTSTGRVTTARCRILVRCEQAPALELDWPLTAGWEPVTVQSLSGQRPLFFEIRTDQTGNAATLRVHLPGPLEPDNSQILELVFQRPDLTDSGITDLPIGEILSGRRSDSLLILPAVPASTALVNLSRTLTTPVSDEDFARRAPWFPITSSSESEQQFDILGKSPFRRLSTSQPESLAAPFINYRFEIQDGTALETTRFTFNEDCVPVASVGFLVPPANLNNLKWTINGQPCTPIEADRSSASGQPLWMLPPSVIPTSGQEIVVVAETQTTVTQDMVASIVLPDTDTELRGQIELLTPADVRATVDGLQEIPAPRTSNRDSGAFNQHLYRLPSRPDREPLRLRIGASQRAPRGETISSHVFHILDERSSELSHEVLAVSRIRRTGQESSLPLFIDPGLRPYAIVDGSHVQLVDTEQGILVPLPSSRDECDVVLVWNEPSAISLLNSSPLTIRQVFEQPGQSQQTTHHFLVAPELELKSPGIPWSTSAPADAAEMLGRLVATESNSGPLAAPVASSPASRQAAPLGFLTRWKLFASMGYQHRTVADSSPNTNSALVYVTSLNLRRALMYGICVVSVTAGLVFLTFVIRNRLAFAIFLLLLSVSRYLNVSPLFDAVLAGWFWGWTAILVFAIVISTLQFTAEPVPGGTTSAVLRNALLLMFVVSQMCAPLYAQETPPPAAITPAATPPAEAAPDLIQLVDGLMDGPGLFLKKELFDRWTNTANDVEKRLPDVLITACSTQIHVYSQDSAEATLVMDVAAVTSSNESQLVVPLQGCRVVECRIDGVEVLPSAGANDTIIVPVPASVLIPTRTIESSDTTDGTIAAPAPAASWDVHRVECRLRPVVQSEFSGLQLRLPALPSHRGTVQFDNSNGLIQRAYVHTGTTPFEWKPGQPEVDMGSLLTSARIDVRIFTESPDTELPQTAKTKLLAICDATGSQLGITCICRISDWNPLAHRVSCRIPPEFELRAVSSPQFGELYWSRTENGADIELYGEGAQAFDLEFRLESRLPIENGTLQIPVASLIELENCIRAPMTVIAVRTVTEFANKPTTADGGRNEVSFMAVQEDFASGSWLRRSDTLFRVDSATEGQTIRLVPRTSTSTVRVSQSIECEEQELKWTLTADVETTIRPLFRHTVSIAPGVEITDVQVVALEANRMDRWHQRNNQLLIQLREATIGTYKITIQGRQKLNMADSEYRIQFPQLKDMQILEFALTLRDRSDSGFLIADTGGAVPDQLLEKNQVLTPGTDFRFQVVNESSPLLLRRRKALPRTGLIASFRDPTTSRLLIHFDDFGNAEEPRLPLASGILSEHLPSVKVGDRLTEAQSVDGELRWLKPETESTSDNGNMPRPVPLTLMWSFPTPTDAAIAVSELISLPQFPFPVEWQEVIVIDADESSTDSSSPPSSRRLSETVLGLFRAFSPELPGTGLDVQYHPASELVSGNFLRLPSEGNNQPKPAESRPQTYVFCDTILRAAPHESVFAETEYTIFCSQPPGRQVFEIPAGITVTRIDSESVIRWENPERTRLSVELEGQVSEVRLRWLGHRSNTSVFSSNIEAIIPKPIDAEFRHLASLHTLDVRMPFSSRTEQEMTADEFSERMVQYLREGYLRTSGSVSSTQAEFRELGERAQRLYERLKNSRELFVEEVYGRVDQANQESVRRFDLNTTAALRVSIPRLPSPAIMLPYLLSVTLIVLCLRRKRSLTTDSGSPSDQSDTRGVQPADLSPESTRNNGTAEPAASLSSVPFLKTGESDVAGVPAPTTVVAPDALPESLRPLADSETAGKLDSNQIKPVDPATEANPSGKGPSSTEP